MRHLRLWSLPVAQAYCADGEIAPSSPDLRDGGASHPQSSSGSHQDRFLANRHRLATNQTNREVLGGPAREGHCLLQGMLVCGTCGRRLTPRYKGNGGLYPTYQCNWQHREALARHSCMTVPAMPLDAAIAERLVAAVTPLTIELALEALTSLEERDQAIGAQWRRRIERARYEADLAERRYEAVDPANRLIAATLEQRWNGAMPAGGAEAELAGFGRQTLRTITADQKNLILSPRRLPAAVDRGSDLGP
jgi:hypothetical protein